MNYMSGCKRWIRVYFQVVLNLLIDWSVMRDTRLHSSVISGDTKFLRCRRRRNLPIRINSKLSRRRIHAVNDILQKQSEMRRRASQFLQELFSAYHSACFAVPRTLAHGSAASLATTFDNRNAAPAAFVP